VDIGTGVMKTGNSSMVLFQMLFQNGRCVAKAETVIVQVYDDKKGSAPLSDHSKKILDRWLVNPEPR
jgi:acyl-CoA thioester hydrolase